MEEIISSVNNGREAIVIDETIEHYNASVICKGAKFTALGWGIVFERKDTEKQFVIFDARQIMWVTPPAPEGERDERSDTIK